MEKQPLSRRDRARETVIFVESLLKGCAREREIVKFKAKTRSRDPVISPYIELERMKFARRDPQP